MLPQALIARLGAEDEENAVEGDLGRVGKRLRALRRDGDRQTARLFIIERFYVESRSIGNLHSLGHAPSSIAQGNMVAGMKPLNRNRHREEDALRWHDANREAL